MIHRIRSIWCRSMHNKAMWPIHGKYVCARCMCEYTVEWAGPASPKPEAGAVATPLAPKRLAPPMAEVGAIQAKRILLAAAVIGAATTKKLSSFGGRLPRLRIRSLTSRFRAIRMPRTDTRGSDQCRDRAIPQGSAVVSRRTTFLSGEGIGQRPYIVPARVASGEFTVPLSVAATRYAALQPAAKSESTRPLQTAAPSQTLRLPAMGSILQGLVTGAGRRLQRLFSAERTAPPTTLSPAPAPLAQWQIARFSALPRVASTIAPMAPLPKWQPTRFSAQSRTASASMVPCVSAYTPPPQAR
jgi:hypothetical protein